MTDTPREDYFFEAVGILGGGESARQLKISERTMRRWLAGESRPPEGIFNDMAALMEDRAKLCLYLSHRLKGEGDNGDN